MRISLIKDGKVLTSKKGCVIIKDSEDGEKTSYNVFTHDDCPENDFEVLIEWDEDMSGENKPTLYRLEGEL